MFKRVIAIFLAILLVQCSPRFQESTPSPELTIPTTAATMSTQISSASEQCLRINLDTGELLGKEYGTIVFDREAASIEIYQKLTNPYLYTPKTAEKISIVGYGFSVSRDGAMFAYSTDENNLLVSNKEAQILASIPIQDEYISHWVNTGLIMENGKMYVFLDPFTGKRIELLEALPNRYVPQGFSGTYENVSFDPTLSRALYFAWDQTSNDIYFSLWDIPNNKEVARIPQSGLGDVGFPAQWSSDGEHAILRVWAEDNEYKFLRIYEDGRVETALNLNGVSYSLSPDDEKLAFWVYDEIEKNWQFSIADLSTKEVVNYCVVSTFFPIMPIWSPNSQNVVIELITDSANAIAVLVDLENNLAVQIADNAKPVGWLK